MTTNSNIYTIHNFQNIRRHEERKKHIIKKIKNIPSGYKYDINKYIQYCVRTNQDKNDLESVLDFLYTSLVAEEVKLNTWERRLAAIKKYISIQGELDFFDYPDFSKEISVMRSLYKEEQYSHLTQINGKLSTDKEELLKIIRMLPTRPRAICLVQLITANRPNEMVRLKIGNFNLENKSVNVYLKKQKEWHRKRLTQEAVKAVKDYVQEYKLTFDDYFVGRLNRNRNYMSIQASDSGYRYMLNKWTGLTGYNFRKTQVVSMHMVGADLPTIAKQTGHKSLDTITKHYLKVSDPTVDKYL